MQALVQQWEEAADQRSIFLNCYLLMTHNMRAALEQHEFHDIDWVDQLLARFADHYFVALDAYEQDPTAAPAVWQLAHNASRAHHVLPLQKLLAGVNAHINYDLVLSLVEMLDAEWDSLSTDQRAHRYADHCHVNTVIGRTIDAVQDQVLDPVMPLMVILDKLMGRVDEALVSHLITHWRDSVWHNVTRLLATKDPIEREQLMDEIERAALRLGNALV
jgi:hypothetical protein